MVKCWAENPVDRLEFSEITQQLEELRASMEPESSVETESDEEVT